MMECHARLFVPTAKISIGNLMSYKRNIYRQFMEETFMKAGVSEGLMYMKNILHYSLKVC